MKNKGYVLKLGAQELRGEKAARLMQAGTQLPTLNAAALRAFWLSVMMDRSAPTRERLAASRLYAKSIGALEQGTQKGIDGARIHWRTIPAEDTPAPAEDTE